MCNSQVSSQQQQLHGKYDSSPASLHAGSAPVCVCLPVARLTTGWAVQRRSCNQQAWTLLQHALTEPLASKMP